ncbi:MAG: M1 family metallopeptidase, partial [Actinomycetota bacterium]
MHTDTAAHLASPYRLPRHITPKRYDLELTPDLAAATFTGEVVITLQVHAAGNVIVLNAKELGINAVRVDGAPAQFELHAETERLVITTDNTLNPGTASLSISFTGILNDKLRGFYRSTYVDDAGNEQVIATTQMQSTDCRRAFPCWDEPDFKAVYGTTLVVDNDLMAISNGPEVSRTPTTTNDKVAVRFADTIPMSTYLVAFIVGRLEATAPVDVNGTPMRLVHVPGKAHLADFGLRIGAFSLKWFEDYYGIKYPGTKVDLVALPDFAAGAME